MRMDYKPVIEREGYARNTAETLYNIVAGAAGNLLKRAYQSRAVRSGVLTAIYFGGQVNVLASNTNYGKKPEQKPNATSKQMDSNSGRANPTSRDGILDKIWDYGTVDQRLRTKGTNHVDTILLFGPYYVVDSGRGVYVVGSDILNLPGEAMRRAKAIKAEEGKSVSAGGEKEDKSTREFLAETLTGSRIQLPATQIGGVTESRNPSSKDSKGPLEGILGFIGDTGRFLGQVVVVAAEGAGRYLRNGVEYVVHNPLDATAKGFFTTWGIVELLDDGGRIHHVAPQERPPEQGFPRP